MLQKSFKYSSNHRKLASITMYHSYFRSGILEKIRIIPSVETTELLRDYEIKLKVIPGGIVLLGATSERFNSASFNNEIQLEFYLLVDDIYFLNYTDISYSTEKRLIFSNSFSGTNLHSADYTDIDCETDEYFGKGITGKITLSLNKNNEFFGELVGNRLEDTINYAIRFNARQTMVRYNLANIKDAKEITDYIIEEEGREALDITFESRKLSSGKNVFSAISPVIITLKEQQTDKYYLKKKDQTFHNYMKYIPQPTINNLSFSNIQDAFISDVYINI
jgi:hypothetical protein